MRTMVKVMMSLVAIFLLSSESISADYEYDVSGHWDSGYVSGEIEANQGSRDIEGYLYTEDGDAVYFEGDWTGYGEIEGYDENANYYELETE